MGEEGRIREVHEGGVVDWIIAEELDIVVMDIEIMGH